MLLTSQNEILLFIDDADMKSDFHETQFLMNEITKQEKQ
jgi:hypothetical protein